MKLFYALSVTLLFSLSSYTQVDWTIFAGLSVIDAINRQLAHYPYHVGQIIYVAKILKDTSWQNLSIPKGYSGSYNKSSEVKDPAKKF